MTVIFDQFERASIFDLAMAFVWDCLNLSIGKQVIFLFVCKSDDFARMLSVPEFYTTIKNEYDIHFLRVSKNEKNAIYDVWKQDILNSTDDEPFLDNLFHDFHSGKIRIIEMKIIGEYIKYLKEKGETATVDILLKKGNHKAQEEFIEKFFDSLLEASESPISTMMVLYSVCYYCRLTPGKGLTEVDFKNITFSNSAEINNLKQFLKSQSLITDKLINNHFRMTHDFLSKYLEGYCENRLPAQITSNIRFYCNDASREMNKKRELSTYYSNFIGSYKNEESKIVYLGTSKFSRHFNTILKATTTILAVLVMCLTSFLVVIDVNLFSFPPNSFLAECLNWGRLKIASVVTVSDFIGMYSLQILASGVSICYIYHYCHSFARITLDWKRRHYIPFIICILLVFLGSCIILLNLVFNKYWGIFLGIEYFLFSVFQFFISELCQENARGQFLKIFIGFTSITFILVLVSIVISGMGEDPRPWYAMYAIFITFCIRQHINKDYMLGKLGGFTNFRSNHYMS